MTASEVAEQFDLHANVARHHLDKLAAGGYLEICIGAARRRCRAAVEALPGLRRGGHPRRAGAPRRRARQLLGRALADCGPDQAEALAEEVGVEYGRTMARRHGRRTTTRSFRSALHAVADALTAHGFAAHAEKEGNELRIVSEHCPFGDAAVEHPVICAVDRGMVKGMLGTLYGETSVDVTSSVPRRRPALRHRRRRLRGRPWPSRP